jgi:hypothetical protein
MLFNHQDLLTIAPNGGITGFSLGNAGEEGRDRKEMLSSRQDNNPGKGAGNWTGDPVEDPSTIRDNRAK